MADRGGLAVLILPLLFAACSSTPEPLDGKYGALEDSSVDVSDIADRYHLRTHYEQDRNRVVLHGPAGRVTLYPRTTVATVNGRRVMCTGRVEVLGDSWTVSKEDSARIDVAMSRRTASKSRPPPIFGPAPVHPPVRVSPPAPPRGPAGWGVPLTRQWRYIVIHHSGTASGSAEAFNRHHIREKGWDGLGYHFVIGNGRGSGDGVVEVGYRWTQQRTGAHAGRGRNNINTMNETGIGIALVGDFNRTRPSRTQLLSFARLVAFLRSHCKIPASGVLVHRDVRKTDCPGRHFPAASFVTPGRNVPASFR